MVLKLRTFLFLISIGMFTIIMGGFYFLTNAQLQIYFTEMESLQRQSISEFAHTVIAARKYSLRSFRAQISRNEDFAQAYLLASSSGNLKDLRPYLKQIKEDTQCDLVDVVHVTRGTPLHWEELSPIGLDRLAREDQSGMRIEQINGLWVLLSFSPLRAYGETVGSLVLGYSLNGKIAKDISSGTNTEVRFIAQTSGANPRTIPISLDVENEKPLLLSIVSNPITSTYQTLRFNVVILGSTIFVVAILLLLLLLEFGFIRRFKELLLRISKGSLALERGVIKDLPPAKQSFIREVQDLTSAFGKYVSSLTAFHERTQQKTKEEATGKIASQVAHDLASPLTALELTLDAKQLASLPESTRELIRAIVIRIRETIKVLADKSRKDQAETNAAGESPQATLSNESRSVEMVGSLIFQLVMEKRLQYQREKGISISGPQSPRIYGLFASIQRNEFKRVLSNIINNAVQAIKETGMVGVDLTEINDKVEIVVVDTGKGIPAGTIPTLFERGVSEGKKGGSGLGLWHAKETIGSWNGTVEITSTQGVGTTVTIRLPKAPPPSWYLSQLSLDPDKKLVVIDDDSFIHTLWEERLATRPDVQRLHFQSLEEFKKWHSGANPPPGGHIYLCDYHFSGEPLNGLEAIRAFKLEKEAILVTGFAEEDHLRNECQKAGVKIVPKTLAANLPVEVRSSQQEGDLDV